MKIQATQDGLYEAVDNVLSHEDWRLGQETLSTLLPRDSELFALLDIGTPHQEQVTPLAPEDAAVLTPGAEPPEALHEGNTDTMTPDAAAMDKDKSTP